MMNCPGCGSFVANGTSVCPYCGSPCAEMSAPKAAPQQSYQAPVRANTMIHQSAGSDVYENNINAVCEILAMTNGEGGRGTGFLVSPDGLAFTNTHVVTVNNQVAKQITVLIAGETVSARVLQLGDNRGGSGDGIDAALIKLDRMPVGATYVKLGTSANIKHGETVFYIGNSLGEGLCITRGIISDVGRHSQGKTPLIMTDAATNPGNSGGPLFNEHGEVIAMHVSARRDAVGMKYSIPIDAVKEEFKRWIR